MNHRVVLPSVLFAAIVALAACGGSDAVDDVSAVEPAGTASETESPDDAPEPTQSDDVDEVVTADSSDAASSGSLTLEDGTTYEFDMSTCATSITDPSSFLIEVGFDAFGRSEDGFTLQVIRAAFEESPDLQPVVGFEGAYDENGVNAQIQYLRDGDVELEIDGGRIFGTVTFRDFFSQQPIHGDGFTADIDINC